MGIMYTPIQNYNFTFIIYKLHIRKSRFINHLTIVHPSPSDDTWWSRDLTPSGRTREITECELALLSPIIGTEWTILGELLHISREQLQQIQQSHSYSIPMQCQTMLIKWRNKGGSSATVEELVRVLELLEVDKEAYRAVIMENSIGETYQK